jgi:hypothetical protein
LRILRISRHLCANAPTAARKRRYSQTNLTENTYAPHAASRSILPNVVFTHPEAHQRHGRELFVGELHQEEVYSRKGALNEPARGPAETYKGAGKDTGKAGDKEAGYPGGSFVAKAGCLGAD